MKKMLFLWVVLFCIGTTAYGYPSVTSDNGKELSDGVHTYTGTLSVTALNGVTTSYTGKTLEAVAQNNKVELTLLRVPLANAAVTFLIQDVTVDQATGVVPGIQDVGVIVILAGIPGNIYGNMLTNQTCDLEFDVLGAGSSDFVRFRYVGTPTN